MQLKFCFFCYERWVRATGLGVEGWIRVAGFRVSHWVIVAGSPKKAGAEQPGLNFKNGERKLLQVDLWQAMHFKCIFQSDLFNLT